MPNKNTCLKIHLAANFFWSKGGVWKAPAKALRYANQLLLGCYIGSGAKIDATVEFAHNGLGVVIHERAVVGPRTLLFQQVTLGVSYHGGSSTEEAPRIGSDVIIGAGAKILGGVTVGDGARIGANAVVLKDVPAGQTAVGVPARILPKAD